MPKNNGNKPVPVADPDQVWNQIETVSADDIPVGRNSGREVGDNFFNQVMLRLEQTPRSESLKVHMADIKARDRVVAAFKHRLQRAYGDDWPECVEVIMRLTDVYIRRGENWRSLD